MLAFSLRDAREVNRLTTSQLKLRVVNLCPAACCGVVHSGVFFVNFGIYIFGKDNLPDIYFVRQKLHWSFLSLQIFFEYAAALQVRCANPALKRCPAKRGAGLSRTFQNFLKNPPKVSFQIGPDAA
ncbi:MAG: hypothetical protein FWC60_01335 [Firmicutes bacterium]|nr:hypothetical protein [Bacillota bacterium]